MPSAMDRKDSTVPAPKIGRRSLTPYVASLSSLHNDNFRNTIVSRKADSCKNSSWMNIEVGGDVSEEMKFGCSFVRAISPTFNIEEAYVWVL